MKTLVIVVAFLTSAQVFAADLICNGRTSGGYPVIASIALRDGEPQGTLTLKTKNELSDDSVKEETFLTESTTFDIALTPYKYWIVELNDTQGLKRGVLVARNSLCSSSSENTKCEENSELALDWNASFPYRMHCVMR